MKKQRPKNIFWILCVFALCAYGFWQNAQKQYTAIMRQEASQIDETGTLPIDDLRYLEHYQKNFQTEFEIELIIKIVNDIESITQPKHPSYLCIVIAPATGETAIYSSTLVRALLGQNAIDTYNQQYLQPRVAQGNWQTGLKEFLNALTEQLSKLLQEPKKIS